MKLINKVSIILPLSAEIISLECEMNCKFSQLGVKFVFEVVVSLEVSPYSCPIFTILSGYVDRFWPNRWVKLV